jgi:cytochrome o ubiquinol oxidase subunit 1
LAKLDWTAIPFDQPIIMGASGAMILAIVFVLSWVLLKGYLPTFGVSSSHPSTTSVSA